MRSAGFSYRHGSLLRGLSQPQWFRGSGGCGHCPACCPVPEEAWPSLPPAEHQTHPPRHPLCPELTAEPLPPCPHQIHTHLVGTGNIQGGLSVGMGPIPSPGATPGPVATRGSSAHANTPSWNPHSTSRLLCPGEEGTPFAPSRPQAWHPQQQRQKPLEHSSPMKCVGMRCFKSLLAFPPQILGLGGGI